MLELIAIILIVLWLTGFFAFHVVAGGAIHVLLVIAVIIIIIRLLRGQRI